MKYNLYKIIFSLIGTTIVLWQLLASGYVLTLDMVFGPHIDLVGSTGDLLNTYPIWWLLSILTTLFSGWVAQKILLVTIFFLLFYLPLHYFNKIFKFEKTYGAEYITSIFFVINPFIYERFLAGHWMVILGYALFFPITAYLIEFCCDVKLKNTLALLISILILGAFSTHLLIISLIILSVSVLIALICKKGDLAFIKQVAILGVALVVLSSYWLVPALINKNGTPLQNFNSEHWEVFKTAGNVVSLHGFWGEHEDWIKDFSLPKDHGVYFVITFILFIALVLYGVFCGIKDGKHRKLTLSILFFILISLVFSIGVGESIFKNFNLWLFEHVSFWKGFRDSQKWSAVVALGYALFAGLGARNMLAFSHSEKIRKVVLCFLILIPIAYTPMILFGFSGQLKVSEYPTSWAEVNTILKQDKTCKALFLPWHQYYSLKFNHDILTGNPSRSYFDCDIWHGKNMELGNIESQGGNGADYDVIEKAVMANEAKTDETIALFKKYGFKYIIFTDDVVDEDQFLYPFLTSKKLEKSYEKDGIVMYKIL